MLVQPPKSSPTQILRELEIPSRTQPMLPSGEWGINRAAAWLVFPTLGLQIFIYAWSSMGKGDRVELLLNGNVVDQLTVTKDADVGQRVTLFVAPRHLQTGSHTLTYRVTRLNQGPETQTPATRIYVKLEIPGGQDIDPEPGHSNLFMYIPPEIVNGGVDKDVADAGVPIIIRAPSGTGDPYPDAAVGDVITLNWGIILLKSPPLTAEQISDPVNHPIVIVVDKATIEKAGDSDYAGLAVAFYVTDIVGNQSEDWSPETRIIVTIGTDLLPAPIAKDAHNNKIDLDQLGDKDLTIQVWASPPSFKFGDIIHLKMRGTSVDGETIEVDAPTQTIDNLPHTYELPLNHADARRLVKTQVIFSYTLARSGSTEPLRSKNQFVQIEGEADRLAAPIAEDAHQGAIDPDLPDAYIRIPFDPRIQVGMAIELSWIGRRHDGTTYNPEFDWHSPSKSEVDNPQGFLISVKGIHLKTLEGGKLDLSYTLLSEKENGEILRRKSHNAAPLNVGEPSLELVAPSVLGERDGALEPNDLPQGTSQLIAPKSAVNPTKKEDVVTFTWIADISGKIEDSIKLNSLSEGKDVIFHLSTEFVARHIEPNRGKKVKTWYRILRAETGKESYSNELEFSVGAGLVIPEITSVKDTYGEEIANGATVTHDNVILTGKASKGLAIEIFDGTSSKGIAPVNANGAWEIHVKALAFGLRSLTAKGNYGDNPVSTARTLVVAHALVPVITAVTDSKGNLIPRDETTVDTNVTLTGTATANRDVKIFLGTTPVGLSPINADGIWTYVVSDLEEAAHSFTAQALYGSNTESLPWPLIVTAMVKPSITSITDSKGVEIPHEGDTVDTSVTLRGTASKGQRIDVLDATESKGQSIVDPVTGLWTLSVTNLSEAVHTFTAKALYGSGDSSTIRTFTVFKDESGSENWDLAPLGEIAFDVPMRLSSGLTLTVSKLTSAAITAEIYVVPSMPELGRLLATGKPTSSRYTFGIIAKKISITYRSSLDPINAILFYDASGQFIHAEDLIVDAFEIPHTLTFEHASGCSYLRLVIMDSGPFNGIAVTDITWA